MNCKLIIAVILIICVLPALPSPYGSRSRSRSSSPTYDQKQTGDYNIQLHLKDFQVVALLSEGALGDLGDYDYNYDYSEMTVKPGGSAASTKPSTTTQKEIPTSTPQPTTTSFAPSTTSSTHSTTIHTPTTATPTTHKIISIPTSSSHPPTKVTTAVPITTTSIPTTTIHTTIKTHKPEPKPSTETKTTIKPFTTTTERKIHVEVMTATRLDTKLEEPVMKDENVVDKLQDVNIIPVKPVDIPNSVHNKEGSNHTELLSTTFRKCSNGYTRDKQGRCRRVRRPVSQFPFGISRLATLASKLRQATGEGQAAPNVE